MNLVSKTNRVLFLILAIISSNLIASAVYIDAIATPLSHRYCSAQ